MRLDRYDLLAVLSGCVWAVIGLLVAQDNLGPIVVGGIAASPAIGFVIGRLFRAADALPSGARAFLSLVSLYVAVALFGLCAGLYDVVARSMPGRIPSAVVLQTIIGCLWGITATGYVVVLWPLAHLNHWLLRRARGIA